MGVTPSEIRAVPARPTVGLHLLRGKPLVGLIQNPRTYLSCSGGELRPRLERQLQHRQWRTPPERPLRRLREPRAECLLPHTFQVVRRTRRPVEVDGGLQLVDRVEVGSLTPEDRPLRAIQPRLERDVRRRRRVTGETPGRDSRCEILLAQSR